MTFRLTVFKLVSSAKLDVTRKLLAQIAFAWYELVYVRSIALTAAFVMESKSQILVPKIILLHLR